MNEATQTDKDACGVCGEQKIDPLAVCCPGEESVTIPVAAEIQWPSGDRLLIKNRWTKIGREKDNDIILSDDTYASRYHAWVMFDNNRFWVEDLGSTNGTLLNGQPLERRELLASGDQIKIGDSEMTFVLLEKTG